MNPRTLDQAQLALWRQRFAALPRPRSPSSWVPCRTLLLHGHWNQKFDLAVKPMPRSRPCGWLDLVYRPARAHRRQPPMRASAIDVPCSGVSIRRDARQSLPCVFLALADGFIVTGEQPFNAHRACMTGRPVAVFPLPIQRKGKARLRPHHKCDWGSSTGQRGYVARPSSRRALAGSISNSCRAE